MIPRIKVAGVAFAALVALSGCGGTGSEGGTYQQSQDEAKNKAKEPVQNQDDIYSYEITLKDGRKVQCVVSYGYHESSIDCDFEGVQDGVQHNQ